MKYYGWMPDLPDPRDHVQYEKQSDKINIHNVGCYQGLLNSAVVNAIFIVMKSYGKIQVDSIYITKLKSIIQVILVFEMH